MNYSTLSLPLRLDEVVRVEVERRFEAGYQVYRAVLREALRRLGLCREARGWQRTAALSAGTERTRLYRSVSDRYGLDEYSLIKYAGRVRGGAPQLKEHLSNMDSQALAKRAWRAVSRYLYADSSGNRFGRPRLPRREELVCISSECRNKQSIVLRGSYQAGPHQKSLPVQRRGRSDSSTVTDVPLYFQWGVAPGTRSKIVVAVHAAHNGAQAARHEYHLSDLSKVVDVQLVRTRVRGRWQYSVHVKVEKEPYRPADRYADVPDGRVGIDLGPQRLALVSDSAAPVVALYMPSSTDREREHIARRLLRRQQRAQERSRRANNPQAYDGKSRRMSVKLTTTSSAYKKRQAVTREAERRRAAEARRQENEIAKRIVATGGKHVIVEDLTVAPWAKLWGSSIRHFSPSRFLQAIQREATLAGGSVRLVSPWSRALSSTCICGTRTKKPLSQRRHVCEECGLSKNILIDLDLFSAYLCLHLKVDQDVVDASRASAAWAGAERLLGLAASTPISKSLGSPVGSTQQEPPRRISQSVSPSKLESHVYPADVVAHGRGLPDGVHGTTVESFVGALALRE